MNDQIKSPSVTGRPDTLAEVILFASGGVDRQEAQGQQELLNSEVIPSELLHCTQEELEALGFVFGDLVEGDPLFRKVQLPEGWSRKGSEHAMWSYIVDTRGIERLSIFYKAAFYDRKAHTGLTNVGSNLSSRWIYGDDVELTIHPELHLEELAAMREDANYYLERAKEHPDIYGDRAPRAQQLLDALDGKDASVIKQREDAVAEHSAEQANRFTQARELHDKGYTNVAIAKKMELSESTVRTLLAD